MNIRRAEERDLADIQAVVSRTIKGVYPHYYPKGAVASFLAHHCEGNIAADIAAGYVFVLDIEGVSVGTVTIKDAEICRLFVLPQCQGKGYGRALLDFSERTIGGYAQRSRLDTSLPAKEIYWKRGYKVISSHAIPTDGGDFLCYDVMEKNLNS